MAWEPETDLLEHDEDGLVEAELELMLIALGAALPPEAETA